MINENNISRDKIYVYLFMIIFNFICYQLIFDNLIQNTKYFSDLNIYVSIKIFNWYYYHKFT